MVTPIHLKRSGEFYRELASLLASGIPILQALDTLRSQPPSPSYRPMLERAARRIRGGASLTEALQAEAQWLGPLDLALLRAGEESGRLVESCRSLAEDYANRARLAERFIASLLYPLFLLHLAGMVFPVDRLPALVWQGDVAGFIRQKLMFFLPLYGGILLLVFLMQPRRNPVWRSLVEEFLHAVPGLGRARRELALSRLASALEALLGAGVGVVESWELSARASGSAALRRLVERWKPLIDRGETPGELIQQTRVIPDMFANLYSTGEISGRLDEQLRHLADYYRDSGERRLRGFFIGLAMAITLGVMLAIAYSIVAFYVGYFNRAFDVLGP